MVRGLEEVTDSARQGKLLSLCVSGCPPADPGVSVVVYWLHPGVTLSHET